MFIGTVICVIRNSIRTSLPFRSYLLTGYRNVSFTCVCWFSVSTYKCLIGILKYFPPSLTIISSSPLIANRSLPHHLLVNCISLSYLYFFYLTFNIFLYILLSKLVIHL